MPGRSDPTDRPFADAGLAELPTLLWGHLQAATESAKPGFHLPSLATVDAEGHPVARIVVLRRVEPTERAVMCHTDRRSPKVAELQRHPQAAWLFYDAPAKLQLRVTGRSRVHTDDALADAQWDASSLSSRRCYLAPAAPGEPVEGGGGEGPSPNLPESVRGRVPTAEEADGGRDQFAVIRTVVERFDMLYLHHAGHRRAEFRFDDTDPSSATGRWLEV